MDHLKTYYWLTKPGIIYGNIITFVAGFLLAGKDNVDLGLLVMSTVGTGLVIASGCVINNLTDRHIDQLMDRTKNRALVSGKVSKFQALIFSILLSIGGFTLLIAFSNKYVVGLGVIGLVDYVVVYAYFKRRSIHSTLIGSICGATPIAAGYIAAKGHLNLAAAILFLILILWQMPHFYSIALYRSKDYRAAALPLLPLVKNAKTTRKQILFYIFGFILACLSLSLLGYTGIVYAIIMGALGGAWFWMGLKKYNPKKIQIWARQMFLFSLIIVSSLSLMLSVGALLP